MAHPNADPRLDEVHRRMPYALMQDARDTSAASIADVVNVSEATVRNRIQELDEYDAIRGVSGHIADVRTLTTGRENRHVLAVADTTAPVVGRSIEAAGREDAHGDDTLIPGIERGDWEPTNHVESEIRSDDVVTVLSRVTTESGTRRLPSTHSRTPTSLAIHNS